MNTKFFWNNANVAVEERCGRTTKLWKNQCD